MSSAIPLSVIPASAAAVVPASASPASADVTPTKKDDCCSSKPTSTTTTTTTTSATVSVAALPTLPDAAAAVGGAGVGAGTGHTVLGLSIKSMTCSDCALSIETTLAKLKGVIKTKVSSLTAQGEVTFDDTVASGDKIVAAIIALGFPTTVVSTRAAGSGAAGGDKSSLPTAVRLSVKEALAPRDETAFLAHVKDQIGVLSADITRPKTGSAVVNVTYDPAVTGARTIIAAAPPEGYTLALAPPVDANDSADDDTSKQWKRLFGWSLLFCIPIVVFAYIFPAVPSDSTTDAVLDDFAPGLSVSTLVGWVLSTPIQFWICWPLYVSAYRAASYAKQANMDTLVVMSTLTAYVYSVVATVCALSGSTFSDQVFFETTAILMTLIMFGRTLEVMAKGRASRILMCMMELQATTALLLEAAVKKSACSSSNSTAGAKKEKAGGCCADESDVIKPKATAAAADSCCSKPSVAATAKATLPGMTASTNGRVADSCCAPAKTAKVISVVVQPCCESECCSKSPKTCAVKKADDSCCKIPSTTTIGSAAPKSESAKAGGCCATDEKSAEPQPVTATASSSSSCCAPKTATASVDACGATKPAAAKSGGCCSSEEKSADAKSDAIEKVDSCCAPKTATVAAAASGGCSDAKPKSKSDGCCSSKPAAAATDAESEDDCCGGGAKKAKAEEKSAASEEDDCCKPKATAAAASSCGSSKAKTAAASDSCCSSKKPAAAVAAVDSCGSAKKADSCCADKPTKAAEPKKVDACGSGGDCCAPKPKKSACSNAGATVGETTALVAAPAAAETLTPSQLDAMTERSIDIQLLQRGDILKVLPGTKVPTDGVVVLGLSTIDESMVTGESVPVPKKVGDAVYGSTINQTSPLYIRVTKVASENTLSAISRLVQEAQTSKPEVQRMADRIAGVFVPCVIVISVICFIVWYVLAETGAVDTDGVHPVTFALQFALATLVVSCPCAVGLAVPTAVMSATGVGAKLGILFKGGEVIEAAHTVDTVVFDKTGTLTKGKPGVAFAKLAADLNASVSTLTRDEKSNNDDAKSSYGSAESAFWYFVGSAESGSEHVIATSLLNHAKLKTARPLVTPANYKSVPGKGLICSVDGTEVVIGTESWLTENKIANLPAANAASSSDEYANCTVIHVGINAAYAGTVGLRDELKPESKLVVAQLRALGIQSWMISGDHTTTAQAVAKEVGIDADHVMGRVLPSDKAAQVSRLQRLGHRVAMVGDGVNDSPALAQADVGIAVASGTDMALEAAKIVLLKHDLRDVLVAFDLSRRTFVRIRWNFYWAFSYNVAAITLATGVWYSVSSQHVHIPPALAGLSELFSSIPVVLCSLLLQAYTVPDALMKFPAAAVPTTASL